MQHCRPRGSALVSSREPNDKVLSPPTRHSGQAPSGIAPPFRRCSLVAPPHAQNEHAPAAERPRCVSLPSTTARSNIEGRAAPPLFRVGSRTAKCSTCWSKPCPGRRQCCQGIFRSGLPVALHRHDLPTNRAPVATELRKAAQLWDGADQCHRAPAVWATHLVRFVLIWHCRMLTQAVGRGLLKTPPPGSANAFSAPAAPRQPGARKTHGRSRRATARQLPPRATSAARERRSGQPKSERLLRRPGTENCGIREKLPTLAICRRASSHRCNAGIGAVSARLSPTCQR